MSYHHCPIEPPDWFDGPNDMEGNCHTCDGTGTIDGENEDMTCPTCGGSGYIEPDEPEWGDCDD